MKRTLTAAALLLFSLSAAADAMTSGQLSDAEFAAKLIVHQVVREADGSYSIWTRSSVQWYGFTLYTCTSVFVNDLLSISVGRDLTTYELANLPTARGWKMTWLKSPWGNTPPENMTAWCLQ